MFEIQRLGQDPHSDPDFSDKGDEGEPNGILIDEFAVLYYVDHAVQRVSVVDVIYADQIWLYNTRELPPTRDSERISKKT